MNSMKEFENLRRKVHTLGFVLFIINAIIIVAIVYAYSITFLSDVRKNSSNETNQSYETDKYKSIYDYNNEKETNPESSAYDDTKYILLFGAIIISSQFINIPLTLLRSKYNKISQEYINKYKNEIVSDIIIETFKEMNVKNLQINYGEGIPVETIKESEMIKIKNHYESSDLYRGEYQGVNFECSDVLIQDMDSDGTITYFQGQWYVLEFNKEFQGNLQVRENGFDEDIVSVENMEEIKVEDEEFNNSFSVFSSNAHTAFYILTPHIIQAIKEISTEIKGDLLFCFFDSKLHIGVFNYEDNFSPSIETKFDIDKERKRIKQEIFPVSKFIDELNLDNKIFK